MSCLLYPVEQAYAIPAPVPTTTPDVTAYRGQYGDMGQWEAPLTGLSQPSTIVPQTVPLAVPAMKGLASVSIYSSTP